MHIIQSVLSMLSAMPWADTRVEILTFLMVLIGIGAGLIQWRRQIKRESAEFLKALLDELWSPDDAAFIYGADYAETWYGPKFHGSEKERIVDRTLSFFAFVCYLRSKNLLDKVGFVYFGYQIERILENVQVKDYLYNIHHFAVRCGSVSPFIHLVQYGFEHGLIDKAIFLDSASHEHVDYLHQYLNFEQ